MHGLPPIRKNVGTSAQWHWSSRTHLRNTERKRSETGEVQAGEDEGQAVGAP